MCHKKVYHWVKKVRKKCRQAGFSRHFCEALEIYSKGVARAKSSQIRKIATKVKGNRNSHRRRLQRFVGRKTDRCAWFEVWTAIVLQKIRPKSKRLVLVVDEVKIEDRFGAMVVGLAYAAANVGMFVVTASADAFDIFELHYIAGVAAIGPALMIVALIVFNRVYRPLSRRSMTGFVIWLLSVAFVHLYVIAAASASV